MSHIYYPTDLGLVECSSTVGCMNSDLGTVTARECCNGNQEGLAYTLPGSGVCHMCTVGKLKINLTLK